MLLPIGMIVLVTLLVLFKIYRYFPVPWLSGLWLSGNAFALIGFSYFIFRVISFLHLQSILKKETATPLTLLYYTLFPPTITSGPIQKYPDFRQQLEAPAPIDADLLRACGYRVTRGFFRKLVVAGLLNGALQSLLTVVQPTIWISGLTIMLLYLFFYFDFAGYSDIAIGFGLLLGIRVPENFRKPFGSTTVSEFWRNYHITLVDWFRDQVFIPLGGMKGSRLKAAALAGLVMVLCGFWHGLTISFAAWGLWHGTMLFTEAIIGSKPVPPSLRSGIYYWSRVLWTNARVALGAVFFLPDPAATVRLLKGFTNWGLG
jgi:alginate O-acetyltransferase complex protein AlgI